MGKFELSAASPTALISPSSINTDCQFFIDSGYILDVNRVASKTWATLPSLPFNGGYQKYPVWIRYAPGDSLQNHQSQILAFDHPLLDTIQVFVSDSSGIRLYATGGIKTDKQLPALKDVLPSFELPQAIHGQYELFIKVATSDVYALSVRRLDQSQYLSEINSARFFEGCYFGAILILVLINSLLYMFIGVNSCRWYTLYIISFGLFQAAASGFFGMVQFIPLEWNQFATPIFANLSLITGAVFVSRFLKLPNPAKIDRILDNAFVVCAVFSAILIVVSVLFGNRISSIGISILAPAFILMSGGAGVTRVSRLGRPAQFMVCAIAAIAIGVILNTLRNFGVLPHTMITSFSNQIGSVLEFTILTIALVDRIASIEKEKQDALLKNELMLRKSAEDQLRLIKEQKEIKVQYQNHIGALQEERTVAQMISDNALNQVRYNLEAAQRLVAENRLRALQAQINPHFLFNALNTLVEQITVSPKDAEKLVIALSRHFRYVLTISESGLVTLASELDNLDSYLAIEKMRMGSRFDYSISVVGDSTQCQVMGLIIQPIVENCLKHGISTCTTAPARIDIGCTILPDRIFVCVSDNGAGFGSSTNKSGTGHGLNNVKERLHVAYGESARLNWFNSNGAVVEIILPREIQS